MRTHPITVVALVVAGLTLDLSFIQPGAAASWTLGGAMIYERDNHTATLLSNGRVLVTGGTNDHLATAELYDPATGTWTATGRLKTARRLNTATLLPDGRVLVVGGYDTSYNGLSSAELYDPAMGTWTETGPLHMSRCNHTATLLPDGRVLVAGGLDDYLNAQMLASAEVYDPITGNWTATGPMAAARHVHTATLLSNGNVLVAGGETRRASGELYSLLSAELYDPNTGTWTNTGAMTTAQSTHTATLLPNGKVLAVGLFSAELYDSATGMWTGTGSPATKRAGHTANLLPNGKVMVIGGLSAVELFLPSAETYDPDTETWSAAGTLTAGRQWHTATLLPGGQVLVTGGGTATSESYDSGAGMWTHTSSMHDARVQHTATLLSNGNVLVAGGIGTNTYLATAEQYNPETGTWKNTGVMTTNREWHTSTLLTDGKVLVVGGYNKHNLQDNWLSSAEVYDPAIEFWSPTSAMTTGRYLHTAVLLRDGTVLIVGGYGANFSPLSSSELYDPTTGSWSPGAAMNNSRVGHTATVLPNGKVLVAGGYGGAFLSSAELYDPSNRAWSEILPLATARSGSTATLLPNGNVLIAGGYNSTNDYVSSAEVYDSSTGNWVVAGSLNFGRFRHGATLLSNGKVLITGGYGNDSGTYGYLDKAEVYDPATGLWTTTEAMATARDHHTVTLLPNGKALVAGGHYYLNTLPGNVSVRSAELYAVGLGFSNSWRPQIASITSPLGLGSSLVISGSQFRGVSGGSGGNTQDSPTDYPLVQLRRIESGQTTFLPPMHWSTNSFTSAPVTNFPPGYAMVTVFVNGIPSKSSLIAVLEPCDVGTSVTGPSTVSPGVSFGYVCMVTNFGTGTAYDVVVSSPVPSGLAFVSATGNGQLTNGVVIWNAGALPPTTGASFVVTLKAPADGSFTNVVTVTSSTPDTNPANDSSQAFTSVTGGTFSSFVARPTLNPLTGAYEELVTVTNIGNPLVAVRLLVGDLPPRVFLHNAAGTNNGKPYAEYTVAMNTGDSRTFLLQFANPYRVNFTNTVGVIAVLPQAPATNTAAGVILSRVFMDANIPDAPRFTFGFGSIPGRSYQILFSDDGLQTWSVAHTVTASANWTIWTELLPPAQTRFFKAVLLP